MFRLAISWWKAEWTKNKADTKEKKRLQWEITWCRKNRGWTPFQPQIINLAISCPEHLLTSLLAFCKYQINANAITIPSQRAFILLCLIRLWLLITHAVCVCIKKKCMYKWTDSRGIKTKIKVFLVQNIWNVVKKKKKHWKIHYGQHSKISLWFFILIFLAKICDTMCVILSFVVYTLIYVHSYVYICGLLRWHWW